MSLLQKEYNKYFNKYKESFTIDEIAVINSDFNKDVDSSHDNRVMGRNLHKNITNINAQINDQHQQFKVSNTINTILNILIIVILFIGIAFYINNL